MSDYLEVEHIVRQTYGKDQSDFKQGQDIVSSLDVPTGKMGGAYKETGLYDYIQYQRKLQAQSCQYQNKESHRIPVSIDNHIVTFRPFFNTLQPFRHNL